MKNQFIVVNERLIKTPNIVCKQIFQMPDVEPKDAAKIWWDGLTPAAKIDTLDRALYAGNITKEQYIQALGM